MRACAILFLVALSATTAHADSGPLARCEKAKLGAAAKAGAMLIRCQAKAAATAAMPSAQCVAKAGELLAKGFAKGETQGSCPFQGEAASVGALLSAAADTLGADLRPAVGASKCASKKLGASAKRLADRLKAEAKHAFVPERAALAEAVAKVLARFAVAFVEAEDLADCTTSGDQDGVAAAVDDLVADVLDQVRGSLANLAAAGGRLLGAAARADILASMEPQYRELLARQFSYVTLESEFMWANVEPTQGVYNLGPVEETLTFAEQNGLPTHGIPLVWHLILPSWVNASMTPAQLQMAVDERIDTLVGGYAGRVSSWVVVNEAVNDIGSALRPTIFLNKLGSQYIADAFVRARQADPNALLFYNDYLADGITLKSNFIYDMVVDLLAQGVPIDGVGLQMHLGGLFSVFG